MPVRLHPPDRPICTTGAHHTVTGLDTGVHRLRMAREPGYETESERMHDRSNSKVTLTLLELSHTHTYI